MKTSLLFLFMFPLLIHAQTGKKKCTPGEMKDIIVSKKIGWHLLSTLGANFEGDDSHIYFFFQNDETLKIYCQNNKANKLIWSTEYWLFNKKNGNSLEIRIYKMNPLIEFFLLANDDYKRANQREYVDFYIQRYITPNNKLRLKLSEIVDYSQSIAEETTLE